MAELLERLRRERGISQLQLADGAKVNSSVVNRAERGGNATLETWVKLFEGLGYCLSFDVEEAERRRENRLMGLVRSGKNLLWPY